MIQTYLVEFEYDRDDTKRYQIIKAGINASWRDLQQQFDPNYLKNNLKFFYLGGEIKLREGQ